MVEVRRLYLNPGAAFSGNLIKTDQQRRRIRTTGKSDQEANRPFDFASLESGVQGSQKTLLYRLVRRTS